jgi:hypothetical protein
MTRKRDVSADANRSSGLAILISCVLMQAACGGGSLPETQSSPPPPVIFVTISPTSATLPSGATVQFVTAVTGNSNTAVMWSASAGVVSSSGAFVAQAVTTNTAVTVTATSQADDTKSASATVTVVPIATQNWGGGAGPGLPITTQCFAGDFNGDGKADIACDTGFAGGDWAVYLSTGSGWQSETWDGGPEPPFPVTAECLAADFNGDGMTDLACYLGNGSTGPNAGVWQVALSTGSGWQLESWSGGPGPGLPITNQCFAGDFNGDGKADIACDTGFAGGMWNVALSTGSGWQSENWDSGPQPTLPVSAECLAADFNGDGKTDLACYLGNGASGQNAGVWQMGLSTGSGWDIATWSAGPGPSLPVTAQCFSSDFSGDGKADIACDTGFAGGMWNVAVSTGSSWQSEFWNGGPEPAFPVSAECLAADFNGDGKTDLACYLGNGASGQNAGIWGVTLSYGNGW